MEFSAWVSVVAELLIEGGSLENGKVLVGEEGFDTYLVSPVRYEAAIADY